MKSMKNPTERFTETVANYLQYRPHYPTEIKHYAAMLTALKSIFDRYQKNGVIDFLYKTPSILRLSEFIHFLKEAN